MAYFLVCSSFLECSAVQPLGAGKGWLASGLQPLNVSGRFPGLLRPCRGPPQPSAGSFPPSSQPPLPGLTASYLGHSTDSLHGNLVHESSWSWTSHQIRLCSSCGLNWDIMSRLEWRYFHELCMYVYLLFLCSCNRTRSEICIAYSSQYNLVWKWASKVTLKNYQWINKLMIITVKC